MYIIDCLTRTKDVSIYILFWLFVGHHLVSFAPSQTLLLCTVLSEVYPHQIGH